MAKEEIQKLSKQDQFTYLVYHILFKIPKSKTKYKIVTEIDKIKTKVREFEGFEVFCYEHEGIKTFVATNQNKINDINDTKCVSIISNTEKEIIEDCIEWNELINKHKQTQ